MSLLSSESRYALSSRGVTLALIALGLLAFALKAWSCLCLFPVNDWNDVRIRPAFLIADGIPLYPGLREGLITTWIYGPAHPLVFLPVTLWRDIQSVYLAAGVLNIVQFVGAFAFACLLWPSKTSVPRRVSHSILVGGIGLLLIPNVFLAIAQADNVCLVFGLLSITCLVRHVAGPSTACLWGAAFFGCGAAFAKLHGFSVVAGELLWFALVFGPKRLGRLLVPTLVCAMVWSLVTLSLATSPRAVWEHVVLLPSKLPWATDLHEKLVAFAPYLILMVLLPGAVILALYRLKLISRLAWLPIIVWLLSLPLGVMGALKQFGSINSLHGVFYLLPLFLIELDPDRKSRIQQILRAVGLVAILGVVLVAISVALTHFPRAPLWLRMQQAEQLAHSQPQSVWIPWRPLATYLATGKNYHDEDGLFVRQLTGLYPSRSHAYSALPAQWSMTAVELFGMDWGIARTMQPDEGKEAIWGSWRIYSFHPSGGK
jgi:hypothetical protein